MRENVKSVVGTDEVLGRRVTGVLQVRYKCVTSDTVMKVFAISALNMIYHFY